MPFIAIILFYSHKTLAVCGSEDEVHKAVYIHNSDDLKLRIVLHILDGYPFSSVAVTDKFLCAMTDDGFYQNICIEEGPDLGKKTGERFTVDLNHHFNIDLTICPADDYSVWIGLNRVGYTNTAARNQGGITTYLDIPETILKAECVKIDNDAIIALKDNRTLHILPLRMPLHVNTVEITGLQPNSYIIPVYQSRMFLLGNQELNYRIWKLNSDNATITSVCSVVFPSSSRRVIVASDRTMMAYTINTSEGLCAFKLSAEAKPQDLSFFDKLYIYQLRYQST
jgi:hypothetical protein